MKLRYLGMLLSVPARLGTSLNAAAQEADEPPYVVPVDTYTGY